jgi:hypothetical protein
MAPQTRFCLKKYLLGSVRTTNFIEGYISPTKSKNSLLIWLVVRKHVNVFAHIFAKDQATNNAACDQRFYFNGKFEGKFGKGFTFSKNPSNGEIAVE